MKQIDNIVNKRYGKLTVIEYAGKRKGRIIWKCQCDCGNINLVLAQSLRYGQSTSCGKCPPTNVYFNNYDGIMSMFCDTGDIVVFDSEDYFIVRSFQWSIGRHGYATSGAGKNQILFHRLITRADKNQCVDHINLNKLDNRKINLRLCSRQENMFNRSPLITNTTGYKGVCLQKRTGKFQAQIQINKRSKYLGSFSSANDAASAYDKAAKEIFGEFAWLNFPEGAKI